MYPYHNKIKQRIKNGELIDYEFVSDYKNIGECLLLYFNCPPFTRPISTQIRRIQRDIERNKNMNVLVACEESQRVCTEFRKKGHNAFSCDIIDQSGGHPEWHIMQDVLPLINGNCKFETTDGVEHEIQGKWDMIIAHPPCTRLCSSGQRWLYWGTEEYRNKKTEEQKEAIDFFMQFVNADCDKIVIENPIGIMSRIYRKPDCIYNPYDFENETECKKTCLWIKGVETLKPTREIPLPKNERTQGIWKAKFDGKQYAWNSPKVSNLRSKTPLGVAKAMAEQWG